MHETKSGPCRKTVEFNVKSFPRKHIKQQSELTLVADAWGDERNQPVIFLHGGGQTRWSWKDTAKEIAQLGFYCIVLDMRGHGQSSWDPNGMYFLDDFAHDLRQIVDSMNRGPILIGASLGGLTSLYLIGGHRPRNMPRAVILVDIAPKMERAGVERVLNFMGSHSSFATLDEAAKAIAQYQPHRKHPANDVINGANPTALAKQLAGLKKNLRQDPNTGRWVWHWDPKFLDCSKPDAFVKSEQEAQGGATSAEPESRYANRLDLYARSLSSLQIPTLLVRGKLSDMVSEESVKHFLDLVPNAEYVDVSNASHMVVGDRNDVFSQAVARFLIKHKLADVPATTVSTVPSLSSSSSQQLPTSRTRLQSRM